MSATTQSATFPFPARLKTELQLDAPLLAIVFALLSRRLRDPGLSLDIGIR